jgi:hypothetical protein
MWCLGKTINKFEKTQNSYTSTNFSFRFFGFSLKNKKIKKIIIMAAWLAMRHQTTRQNNLITIKVNTILYTILMFEKKRKKKRKKNNFLIPRIIVIDLRDSPWTCVCDVIIITYVLSLFRFCIFSLLLKRPSTDISCRVFGWFSTWPPNHSTAIRPRVFFLLFTFSFLIP